MSDIIGQLEADLKLQIEHGKVEWVAADVLNEPMQITFARIEALRRAEERVHSLNHLNNILAQRCAAQAKEIARLISVYETNPSPRDVLYRSRAEDGCGGEMGPHHEHPAVKAIEVMQKLGVR